jgi:hypothetical protein
MSMARRAGAAIAHDLWWGGRLMLLTLYVIIRTCAALAFLGVAIAGAVFEWAPALNVPGYGQLSIGEINQLCNSDVGRLGQSLSGSLLRSCGDAGLAQVLAIAAIPLGLFLAFVMIRPIAGPPRGRVQHS